MGNARAYGRWLGIRYRDAPNIVWVSGGDRIPTRYESVYRELALGLREGDGGAAASNSGVPRMLVALK